MYFWCALLDSFMFWSLILNNLSVFEPVVSVEAFVRRSEIEPNFRVRLEAEKVRAHLTYVILWTPFLTLTV